MRVITSIQEMQSEAEALRRSGARIGFVPTMGSLHQGHASLIGVAREHADHVVVSIFVNPAQFSPHEDFKDYPRDLQTDLKRCEAEGVDSVFAPTTEEMYPAGGKTAVFVEELSHKLEGVYRPTHFKGVTTVVAKLFHIVKPHVAVFGQKDAQQAIIIRRMTEDLNFDIQVVVAPTVREPDGLALSSRNTYLSPDERRDALVISQSLSGALRRFQEGERDPDTLRKHVLASLDEHLMITDYVAVVNAQSLQPIRRTINHEPAMIAVAARVGKTRLIDNILLTERTGDS